MGNLSDFGENMRACAVYDPVTGIFESIIVMPEAATTDYATGNNLVFEWIDSLDVVPTDDLSVGKIIRRISPGIYRVEDRP
jgi:hypothetical protein